MKAAIFVFLLNFLVFFNSSSPNKYQLFMNFLKLINLIHLLMISFHLII